ncbi:MAG: transglutaminase family protein [Candidatus Thorarchaeota archaeon]
MKPSELCDWHNPDIMRKAKEIRGKSLSQKETALNIFHFVRDEIVFSINNVKTKASQTLRRGAGECGTKTNLHVALLRASGIPARFHLSRCKSEVLKGIIPDWLSDRMPKIVSHFWPEAYLSERWLACEGMLDRGLYSGLLKRGFLDRNLIPNIDWDGESNLIILKPWLVEDCGTTPFYENIYAKMDANRKQEGMPPKVVDRLFGWIIYSSFKRHTDRLREPLI